MATRTSGAADPLGPRSLDFWLGDWDVTWDTPRGQGRGRNRLTRVVGRRGILERFDGRGPLGRRLHGMSVSIRDSRDGRWRQTWIDSSGSYLDLVGVEVDGRISFEMQVVEEGRPVKRRMTWSDVTAEAFVWRWQESKDQGASWTDLWRIDYRRRPRPVRTTAGAATGTRRSAR
jgi:hypothetical protein